MDHILVSVGIDTYNHVKFALVYKKWQDINGIFR